MCITLLVVWKKFQMTSCVLTLLKFMIYILARLLYINTWVYKITWYVSYSQGPLCILRLHIIYKHSTNSLPDNLYLLSFKYRDGSFFHSAYSGVQSTLFVSLGGTEGGFKTTESLGSDQFLTGVITLSYKRYTPNHLLLPLQHTILLCRGMLCWVKALW